MTYANANSKQYKKNHIKNHMSKSYKNNIENIYTSHNKKIV